MSARTISIFAAQRATRRRNIAIFLRRWDSIPPENVIKNLRWWQDTTAPAHVKPTCNTIACAGGWFALMPEFREMGVRMSAPSGAPCFGTLDSVDDIGLMFFGGTHLFARRGGHKADALARPGATDHEIVKARFVNTLIALAE